MEIRQETAPLGHREKRIWPANPSAIGGRSRRKGGPYEVFIPERIAERTFAFGGDSVTAISSATWALGALNAPAQALGSLNQLASNLLRSESSSSSRIEGLQVSPGRLAKETFAHPQGREDQKVIEILGNVEAMKKAIDLGEKASPITVGDIREIHRILLERSANSEIAGRIRKEQNWIGGNDYNPIGAVFVPPPPETVEALLEDLCRFLAREDLTPIAQAAIAHAQFENIHPFEDGNGRVGRSLIYTILRRGGESEWFIPPVSIVFANELRSYQAGFGVYSAGRVDEWVELFADATQRACVLAGSFVKEISELQETWIKKLKDPRSDAAVRQLIEALPGQPVIDVGAGIRITSKSRVSVQKALAQLEDAEILTKLDPKKWGRAWESRELLDLAADLEDSILTG